jgi:hypothetical protein
LLEMLNSERKCSLLNPAGITPVRLLFDMSSTSRFVRLHIDIGICPIRSLKLN